MSIKGVGKLVVTMALATVALGALVLALSIQSALAQGDEIYVHKQLGRANPVVYVGEYLTFTIYIRNDTTFTVTTLPLSDTYNAAVLAFVDAVPPPDSVSTPPGRLDWTDLTTITGFSDLAPGGEITVVVGFIAEHPQTAVVNAAEVHDALGESGSLTGTNSTITDTESIGGSSPVEKSLMAGLSPQVGLPLTFTVVITNDGFVTMTVAPLVDRYNPAWLTFSYAVPPPDLMDTANGVLTWTDVTSWTGDIPPHQAVSVTTVFTALVSGENITNQAEVSGASDWYDNVMDGGADEVPITIIDQPTATPTTTPTAIPAPTNTPAPAAPTPVPATATPTPTATPEATPTVVLLPETGRAVGTLNGNWVVVLFALGTATAFLAYSLRTRAR
jgi:hypothetical protein